MKVPIDRQGPGAQAYDAFLAQEWSHDFRTHPPPKGSLLECVLVEPRPHPRLAAVLRNVSAMLPHAALTVVGSRRNVDAVAATMGAGTNVRFLDAGADDLPPKAYSALLSSPRLYSALGGRHLLFFQTDTGLRLNRVLRFLEYDYVGAPWDHIVAGDPRIRVGNGGLSLRRREKMIEVLCRNRPDHAAFETLPGCGEPEDVFIARCLRADPFAVLPDAATASAFSVEAIWHDDPMGFHQPHMFWEGADLQRLLSCDRGSGATLKVEDAWLELANGRRCAHPDILAWARLGAGAAGVCIPRGSVLPTGVWTVGEKITRLVIQTSAGELSSPVEGARVARDLTQRAAGP